MRKKRILSVFCIFLLLLVVSCKDEPEPPVVKEISVEECVAYIGSSVQEAQKRFLSLQDAVNYVKTLQTSDTNIINLAKSVTGDGVSIDGLNLIIDFGDFTYTLKENCSFLILGKAEVLVQGKKLSGSDSKPLFIVESGSLSTKIDFSGSVQTGSEGLLKLEEGTVKIEAAKGSITVGKNCSCDLSGLERVLNTDGEVFWFSTKEGNIYFTPDYVSQTDLEIKAAQNPDCEWLLDTDFTRVVIGTSTSTDIYPLTILGEESLVIKVYSVAKGTTDTNLAVKTGTYKYANSSLKEEHAWQNTSSQAATCTAAGFDNYKCTFCETTRTDIRTKLGHNSKITYSWTTDSDNHFCAADWSCTRCEVTKQEKTTATVFASKEPTYKATGYTTYQAVFKDKSFSTQKKTETIKKTGPEGNFLDSYEILKTTKPTLKVSLLSSYSLKFLVNLFLEKPSELLDLLEDLGIDVSSALDILYDEDPNNCFKDLNNSETLEILKDLVNRGDCDITLVRYTYNTIDLKGNPTKASALAFFPQASDYKSAPIYSGQRTAIADNKSAPTSMAQYYPNGAWDLDTLKNMSDFPFNLVESLYYYLAAQTGFIAIMPDGLGFGANAEGTPTFGVNAVGRVFADAVYACEELSETLSKKTKFNGKVFLGGYSEGGYISMSTARQMFFDGEEPDGIACGDGCYSISGVTLDDMKKADKTFSSPYYVAMMFNALSDQYGQDSGSPFNFYNAIRNDVANFQSGLYTILHEDSSTGQIDSMIKNTLGSNYTGPLSILSQQFLTNFLPTTACMDVLKQQDAFRDFLPTKCKIRLIHNENDEMLTVENAEAAEDYFENNGVNANLISTDFFTEYMCISSSVHVSASVPAIIKSYDWIYNQAY